jgi:hypothetical protein
MNMFEKMTTLDHVLVREREQKRLLETSGRQRPVRRTSTYQPLLARLGEQLVKWGCRLQAQYGTLAEASNSLRYVKTLRQQLSA